MPTPTRSRQGSPGTRWNRPRQPTTKSWDSICCPMRRFAARPTPPDQHLLQFLHSTHIAAAEAGRWGRAALETNPDRLRHPPAP
jgi:hypothetical protein